jgi:hypothetical protein
VQGKGEHAAAEGAADECAAAGSSGRADGAPHVRACLEEFFREEAIQWECPRSKQQQSPAGLTHSASMPVRKQVRGHGVHAGV